MTVNKHSRIIFEELSRQNMGTTDFSKLRKTDFFIIHNRFRYSAAYYNITKTFALTSMLRFHPP